MPLLSPENAWCAGVIMLIGSVGFLLIYITLIILRKR